MERGVDLVLDHNRDALAIGVPKNKNSKSPGPAVLDAKNARKPGEQCSKRILSWSSDKTLRLWDAATGAAIGEPLRHEAPVNGARYSPDGKRILSWSDDKTLRLWDSSWRGDDLFEIACNYAPMMSSREEMNRLSKRYGVNIGEPICQPGVKIPDPDWSRTEPAHAE